MKKEDIQPLDLSRMIIGEAPPEFFLEIIVRTFVVYAILMVAFRLLGSRMAGTLNRMEQASLVTLAAAIGVPIQSPERGLLPAIIIAVVVVIAGRLIGRWSGRNEKFETRIQGRADLLVQDGLLNLPALRHTTLSRERLFAQLRAAQIVHLGQVQRCYLEADGSFTLVPFPEARPGLGIIPEYDTAFASRFQRSGSLVCSTCGNEDTGSAACARCGASAREEAIRYTPGDRLQAT